MRHVGMECLTVQNKLHQLVDMDSEPLRAAVLGNPIDHSLSPTLHNAGYDALGLNWEYDTCLITVENLPDIVRNSPEQFRGFSVTMPGKFAALQMADTVSDRARLIGSANTLVRTEDGWLADNTDTDGIIGCLNEVEATGSRAVIVGNGGTARPAVWALAQRGFTEVVVLARSARAEDLHSLCIDCAIEFSWRKLSDAAEVCESADVLISTIPAGAAAHHAEDFARANKVVDVIYDPWPTPLMEAADGHCVGGLRMLHAQALKQFELFTGQQAPAEAMWTALLNDVKDNSN